MYKNSVLFTKTKTEAEAEAEEETVGCLLRRRSSREEAARVSASHPRQFSQSQRQPRDTNNKMVNLKSTAFFFFFCLFGILFGGYLKSTDCLILSLFHLFLISIILRRFRRQTRKLLKKKTWRGRRKRQTRFLFLFL